MTKYILSDEEINEALEESKQIIGALGVCGRLTGRNLFVVMDALNKYRDNSSLKMEVEEYRRAAEMYGVDAETMLTLAKSQIKTSAKNIEVYEDIEKLLHVYDSLPMELPDGALEAALVVYDGDREKPYCDIVWYGLKVLQMFYRMGDLVRKYKKGRIEEDG